MNGEPCDKPKRPVRSESNEKLIEGRPVSFVAITSEDILRMLQNDGFGDLVGSQPVRIAPQERLNRALSLACERGHLELAQGAEVNGRKLPINQF